VAPQGDTDLLWAEAHERSYTAETYIGIIDVTSEPKQVIVRLLTNTKALHARALVFQMYIFK